MKSYYSEKLSTAEWEIRTRKDKIENIQNVYLKDARHALETYTKSLNKFGNMWNDTSYDNLTNEINKAKDKIRKYENQINTLEREIGRFESSLPGLKRENTEIKENFRGTGFWGTNTEHTKYQNKKNKIKNSNNENKEDFFGSLFGTSKSTTSSHDSSDFLGHLLTDKTDKSDKSESLLSYLFKN